MQQLANNGTDPSSNNDFSQWGQWVGGTMSNALQAASDLSFLNMLSLPVSINYRNAASTVTVGQYSRIIGSADVTVSSGSRTMPRASSTPPTRSSAGPWRS